MKKNVERTPRDHGTPELQAKKLAAVININTGLAGDPDMSSTELGCMCERGILDQDMPTSRRMYDAGMMLRALWRAVYPEPGASTLGRFMPGDASPDETDRAEIDLKAIIAFFGPKRSMHFRATRDCCVYDRPLFGGKLKKLRRGLNLLIEWQRQK